MGQEVNKLQAALVSSGEHEREQTLLISHQTNRRRRHNPESHCQEGLHGVPWAAELLGTPVFEGLTRFVHNSSLCSVVDLFSLLQAGG